MTEQVTRCPMCGHVVSGWWVDDPYEYRPGAGDAPVKPQQCKAVVIVPRGGRKAEMRARQCMRRATLDGWCWQHHPPEGLTGVVEAEGA